MHKFLIVFLVFAISVLLLSGTASALSSFDSVPPEGAAAISSSEKAEIKISVPSRFDITVDIDGNIQKMSVTVGTKAGNIVKWLESQNNENYVFDGIINADLMPGHKLKLNKVFHEEQMTTVQLMYDTEIILCEDTPLGTEQIEQQGAAGEMFILNSITIVKGNVVKSHPIREWIVTHPVTEIVRQGTKEPLPKVQTEVALRSYTKVMEMTATAYTAGFQCTGKKPGHPAYGITASGVPVDHGIVAVDPKVIPLGTKLYIEGYGESLAADIGGSIVGNKIDLYHESLEDAKKFGRRTVKVYILG